MKAILIIHGLVGSLYDNEYLMNYLEFDNTLKVFAKTLPGHHLSDNYQETNFNDWLKSTSNFLEEIIKYGYDDITVIGHSMGGVITGHLASKYKEIKKIVLINSPFFYIKLKDTMIDLIMNKDYKEYLEILTQKINTSIPFFLEFIKLVKSEQNCLKKINCDVLVLQSELDGIIPIENSREIYNKLNSKNKYLTYFEKEKHIVFDGSQINIDRKLKNAEYIRLFIRGGLKWKKIWKEKI